MRAIRVSQTGGPEVLVAAEVPVPRPGPGEALVRVEAAGLNYVDVYHRTGLYPRELPFTPGGEGAGTVAAVGEGVADVRAGARVAWAMHGGAYAEYAAIPAAKLVPLPDGISTTQGAALILQGLTAHFLAHSTFPLGPGHRALVHAAAGGVGLLLVQMAARLGATVYATVGNDDKAQLALAAGAAAAIVYTREDFPAAVHRLTTGEGVNVVYDSVGQATYEGSLRCLLPRGCLVSYGQASGPVPPLDPQVLSAHGSLYLTRPTLIHYTRTRAELLERARDLFAWLQAGTLQVRIDSTFPLAEAAAAHRRIQSRQSAGKILLLP